MKTPLRVTLLALTGFMLSACVCDTRKSNPNSLEIKAEQCTEVHSIPYVRPCLAWAKGLEGQRKADLGNGMFLNPIMAGDHPDPSIIKDGEDYYMTFSSFEAYPALTIWHSKDLVNWQPIGPAVKKYIGSIWAPELTLYKGRYYLYIPAKLPGHNSIYVTYADNIHGPWSAPIDLDPLDRLEDRIDPGHIEGEDGKRYLFVSGGDYIQLADDGLSVVGDYKHVYDGWQYPEDWVVESFAQEGPKMLKHGDYFYMTLAEGGTAGPATGHMVVAARSKSIHGPWQNSPYNPVIRTQSPLEKWWSRGHATLVQGPGATGSNDEWYMVDHGYENGFYTLGRQALLEPIVWTEDHWFKSTGVDIGKPLPIPKGGKAMPHGMAYSDDFSSNKFGIQWSFFKGDIAENARVHYQDETLILDAEGTSPSNSSPLTFISGDQAYEIQVEVTLGLNTTAGLMLFYNDKLYAGLGVSEGNFILHRYGMDRVLPKPADVGRRFLLRARNDRQILTLHYSVDGGLSWQKFGVQMDVSGYHHNVAYGFLSLRPAIYAAGNGQVQFRDFRYRALE